MPDLTMFYTTDELGSQVELPRPETKSMDDVVQCATHNQGSNDTVVDKFITMYQLGLQWDWFEEYKQYLLDKTKIEDYNKALVPDEDGVPPDPLPLPLPTEPVRPAAEQPESIKKRVYQQIFDQQHSADDWKKCVDERVHAAS